jgi:hypothetical protein
MNLKTFSTIFLISIVSAEHLRYELKSESNSESETIVDILKKLSVKIDGITVRIEDALINLSGNQLIKELEFKLIELLTDINIADHKQQKLDLLLEPATVQVNDVLSELLSVSSSTETVDQLIIPLLASLRSLSTILNYLAETGIEVTEGEIFRSNKLYIKKNE